MLPQRLLKPENAHILAFVMSMIFGIITTMCVLLVYSAINKIKDEVRDNRQRIDGINRRAEEISRRIANIGDDGRPDDFDKATGRQGIK